MFVALKLVIIFLIAAYDPTVKQQILNFIETVKQTISDFFHAIFGDV